MSGTRPSEPNAEDPEKDQIAFAYTLSAERLRARCRWASLVLICTFALPFEVIGETPLFVWNVLGELHPAAALAALAPVAAGVAIGACTRWVRVPSALGLLVLLVLALMWGVIELGSDAAAWDILPLPENLTNRPESMLLALSVSGAAIQVSALHEMRRTSLGLAALAGAIALVFAFWPTRGEIPIATFFRIFVALPELPSFRLMLGYGLILFVAVMPILAASSSAVFALLPGRKVAPLVALLVTFALPGTLLFLVFRSLLLTFGDSSLPASIAAALVLAALLALLSAATETIALWIGRRSAESELEPAGSRKLALAAACAVAAVLLAGQAWLARPPEKGVNWALSAPRADELFGELLPKWAVSHARWYQRSRESGSAALLTEARAAGRELLKGARGVDPGLASALASLLSESNRLDLAGRRWFRLVEGVNEASRAAKLPYYVDPTIMMRQLGADGRRLFLLFPYRIEKVRQADTDDGPFALLHVRQLGETRANHNRLGFSRDMQPFALVVLDEIEPYASSLAELSKADAPTCIHGRYEPPALVQCGDLLQRLAPTVPQLLKLTERHELQHQIDGPHLPISAAVSRALEGYAEHAQREVNRELSAYVAELTAPGVSPKLALIHLLPFAFERPTKTLHHVAILAFEALADKKIRLPTGEASSERLGEAFSELAALPDDGLRSRAEGGWERLFEEELREVRVR